MAKDLNENDEFVLRCDLDDIVLVRCECECISQKQRDPGPYELKYNTFVAKSGYENRSIWAEVSTEVTSTSDSGQQIFRALAVFRLAYTFEGAPPSNDEKARFEATTPVFQAWPFVREIVQNLMARMQFNPPPLPLIKRRPIDSQRKKPKNLVKKLK
jgi:hypothetical protein